jgi:hypothetical protein
MGRFRMQGVSLIASGESLASSSCRHSLILLQIWRPILNTCTCTEATDAVHTHLLLPYLTVAVFIVSFREPLYELITTLRHRDAHSPQFLPVLGNSGVI